MKKTLVAIAAVMASAGAMAQSNVTLYGVVDAVVHKDKGASLQMTSGGLSTSRWGMMGTEDLGGGTSVGFKFEQSIDVTSGAANGFNREAYLSYSAGFGEIKLGKVWSAFDDVAGAGDSVFGANVLSPMNLTSAVWANYNGNPNNGFKYSSPSFGGFSGAVSYALDETAGVKNDVFGFQVNFADGPVAVAFGYQDDGDADDEKFYVLNGSYDFGAFKLLGSYARENKVVGADTKEYLLGVDVPLSEMMTVSVGYGSSKTAGAATAKSFSAAIAYSLSSRTTLYAGFANANNSAVVNRGAPDSRYGVGLRHTF